MGAESEQICEGDFVEAVFVGDQSITRRGVVISVLNFKTVVVKGWDFESLCENPRKLELSQLSDKERQLFNSLIPADKRRENAPSRFSQR